MQDFQNFQPQNGQTSPWSTSFIDAISIVSFFIGLQNLQLNITAADLDKQTEQILSDVHKHLKEQDDHLVLQDRHLLEQDKRIDRLEHMVLEISKGQKGENNNG